MPMLRLYCEIHNYVDDSVKYPVWNYRIYVNRRHELPDELRNIKNLGQAIHIYPIRPIKRWGGVILAAFFGIFSMTVFLYGIYITMIRIQRFGGALVWKTLSLPLLLSILLFLIGSIAAYSVWRNWNKKLVIYNEGFVFLDISGLKVFRWDEILWIKSALIRNCLLGIHIKTIHRYIVKRSDSSQIVLNDSIYKIEDAVTRIRHATFPIMYSRYAQSYNSGHKITFGSIELSQSEGIEVGKHKYPWDQGLQIRVSKGTFMVMKKSRIFSRRSVSIAKIPNFEVMLSIINQVVGIKVD